MGLVVLISLAVGTGCLSSTSSAATASTVSASRAVPRTDAAGTVWLCRPGIKANPCTGDLDTTSITGTNQRTMQMASAIGSQKYDCFYIYPTASTETTVNSNLVVQSAEELIAMAQAARFSQVCDVWAPMYRQITVAGLHSTGGGGTDPGTIAYDSVLSDWKDFITHYDDGRPIIFIGHSQGSVMMIKLLRAEVDPNAAVRKLVVAAIIAGGNVTVPTGKTVGVTFQHLPLCTSNHQSGCVIAYSSFPSEPPSDSMFGRPGQGISLNWGQTATTGVQVACVNPADIDGETAAMSPYFPIERVVPMPSEVPPPPAVTTPWVTYPDLYTSRCESAGGATWLQVTDVATKGDTGPVVSEVGGPTWGYHFVDINLSLGSLVNDVRNAEAAYGATK
jgi:hypothetical protein